MRTTDTFRIHTGDRHCGRIDSVGPLRPVRRCTSPVGLLTVFVIPHATAGMAILRDGGRQRYIPSTW